MSSALIPLFRYGQDDHDCLLFESYLINAKEAKKQSQENNTRFSIEDKKIHLKQQETSFNIWKRVFIERINDAIRYGKSETTIKSTGQHLIMDEIISQMLTSWLEDNDYQVNVVTNINSYFIFNVSWLES